MIKKTLYPDKPLNSINNSFSKTFLSVLINLLKFCFFFFNFNKICRIHRFTPTASIGIGYHSCDKIIILIFCRCITYKIIFKNSSYLLQVLLILTFSMHFYINIFFYIYKLYKSFFIKYRLTTGNFRLKFKISQDWIFNLVESINLSLFISNEDW